MKKLVVVILVVAMLALSSLPALAAGGPPADRGAATGYCGGNQVGATTRNQPGRSVGKLSGFGLSTPYALSGTITALDPAKLTVRVRIACRNRLANPYAGSEVTLQTINTTRFLLRNDDGTVTSISFTDLVAGKTISSHGSLADGAWTASRITMGALLNCLP